MELFGIDPGVKTFTGFKRADVIDFSDDKEMGMRGIHLFLMGKDVDSVDAMIQKLKLCEKADEMNVDVRCVLEISYSNSKRVDYFLFSGIEEQEIYHNGSLFERSKELFNYMLQKYPYFLEYGNQVSDVKDCNIDLQAK